MSSECSSAEEERRIKIAQRPIVKAARSLKAPNQSEDAATTRRLAERCPVPPATSNADLVTRLLIPPGDVPQMKNLSQLLSDCCYLKQNIDGSPLCELQLQNIESGQLRGGAGAASSSATAVGVKLAEKKPRTSEDDLALALQSAIRANKPDTRGHWVKQEFDRMLARLPIPEFYEHGADVQSMQEQLHRQMQLQQFDLFVQTAQLETHLLAEAGTFVSVKDPSKEWTFPPCRNGASCVGMTESVRLQPRPFIFTMIFFEFEYSNFLLTGQTPRVSRPCVQCSRQHMTECVVFDRAVRMCGESRVEVDSVLPLTRTGSEVKQFYQNLCDRPSGYHRIHMLLNNGTPGDLVTEPICMPGRSVLFCVDSTTLVHKETRRPRIQVDQSALVWTAPRAPTPQIGQNLLAFCGGASKF